MWESLLTSLCLLGLSCLCNVSNVGCQYTRCQTVDDARGEITPLGLDGGFGLVDGNAYSGHIFEYWIAENAFGDNCRLAQVVGPSGNTLPGWLTLDTANSKLVGLPTDNDVGDAFIKATAVCRDASSGSCRAYSDVFKIKVSGVSNGRASSPCGDWSLGTSVTVILDESLDNTNANQRIDLLNKVSNFVQTSVYKIFLKKFKASEDILGTSSKHVVAAGPGNVDSNKTDYIEVTWSVTCGQLKELKNLVMVIQHNTEAGRLSQELGYGIVGWYVASQVQPSTTEHRNKRRAGRRTPVPTPVPTRPAPTRVQVVTDTEPVTSKHPGMSRVQPSDMPIDNTIMPKLYISADIVPSSIAVFMEDDLPSDMSSIYMLKPTSTIATEVTSSTSSVTQRPSHSTDDVHVFDHKKPSSDRTTDYVSSHIVASSKTIDFQESKSDHPMPTSVSTDVKPSISREKTFGLESSHSLHFPTKLSQTPTLTSDTQFVTQVTTSSIHHDAQVTRFISTSLIHEDRVTSPIYEDSVKTSSLSTKVSPATTVTTSILSTSASVTSSVWIPPYVETSTPDISSGDGPGDEVDVDESGSGDSVDAVTIRTLVKSEGIFGTTPLWEQSYLKTISTSTISHGQHTAFFTTDEHFPTEETDMFYFPSETVKKSKTDHKSQTKAHETSPTLTSSISKEIKATRSSEYQVIIVSDDFIFDTSVHTDAIRATSSVMAESKSSYSKTSDHHSPAILDPVHTSQTSTPVISTTPSSVRTTAPSTDEVDEISGSGSGSGAEAGHDQEEDFDFGDKTLTGLSSSLFVSDLDFVYSRTEDGQHSPTFTTVLELSIVTDLDVQDTRRIVETSTMTYPIVGHVTSSGMEVIEPSIKVPINTVSPYTPTLSKYPSRTGEPSVSKSFEDSTPTYSYPIYTEEQIYKSKSEVVSETSPVASMTPTRVVSVGDVTTTVPRVSSVYPRIDDETDLGYLGSGSGSGSGDGTLVDAEDGTETGDEFFFESSVYTSPKPTSVRIQESLSSDITKDRSVFRSSPVEQPSTSTIYSVPIYEPDVVLTDDKIRPDQTSFAQSSDFSTSSSYDMTFPGIQISKMESVSRSSDSVTPSPAATSGGVQPSPSSIHLSTYQPVTDELVSSSVALASLGPVIIYSERPTEHSTTEGVSSTSEKPLTKIEITFRPHGEIDVATPSVIEEHNKLVKNFHMTSKSATEIELAWNAPTWGGLNNYQLAHTERRFHDAGKEFWMSVKIPGYSESFRVIGLRPETIYLFEITSRFGDGSRSGPVNLEVKTTEEDFRTLVENFRVSTKSPNLPTEVELLWEHPLRGIPASYLLTYREKYSRPNQRNFVRIPGKQTFYHIIGLRPGTRYIFNISAQFEDGSIGGVSQKAITTSRHELTNHPPRPFEKIGEIVVNQGEVFRYKIRNTTFVDEDGGADNLDISVRLPHGEIPSDFWVQYDDRSHTLEGLPLPSDSRASPYKFLIVAGDSKGKVFIDTFEINVNSTADESVPVTHLFYLKLQHSYRRFVASREKAIDLVEKLANYFGDRNAQYIDVIDIRKGSVILVWTNNSLSGADCKNDSISNLHNFMVDREGNPRKGFVSALHPFIVSSVDLKTLGACSPLPVEPQQATDFDIWASVILPAIIAVIILLILVIIMVFIYWKCSRTRQQQPDTPTEFKRRTKPIILPNDVDYEDSALRPHSPLILPSDTPSAPGTPIPNGDPAANQQYTGPGFQTFENQNGDANGSASNGAANGQGPNPPAYRPPMDMPPAYRLPPPYSPNTGSSEV